MAHVLNISSSLEPVIGTSDVEGSQTYTGTEVDKNTGSIGGLYKSLEYDSAKAIKYVGIPLGSAAAIADAAFEGTPTSTGVAPVTAKVLAVSFDSQSLGTGSIITVTIGSQVHARLKSVGEAVVIPVSGAADAGLAVASFKIHDETYSDDSVEAIVTVILIGV